MNTNTSSSPVAAPDEAIAQLKRDWPQLSDVDRAQAIARIRKSGLSIRRIARELDRKESSLRHLLSALQAPAADLVAARHNQISTNELVRRGKAEAERQEKNQLKHANSSINAE